MTLLARLFDLLARLRVQRVDLLEQRVELIDPLPLLRRHHAAGQRAVEAARFENRHRRRRCGSRGSSTGDGLGGHVLVFPRSEEGRGGKEWGSTGKFWWA